MKHLTFFQLILASLLTFSPAKTALAEDKLTLTGSSTIAPLISEIAKRFEKLHPECRIDVQTGGSSRGIADTKRGLADIGMSSRKIYKEEESGINTHILAIDGVAFITHKDNPVKNLTREQALRLFTGKIKNWKELGGHDSEITVINRAKGRSEHDLVAKFLGIKSREFISNLTCGENQQCIKLIIGNKNALTYLSLGASEYEAANGVPLHLLTLDGIQATTTAVRKQTFPIVRPLILITHGKSPEKVGKFLHYALSSEVNDLVKEQAFVPID